MPQPSPARIESVLRATKQWQKDLVDTSGRNRLVRYRDLRRSTLDLTPARAHGLDADVLDRLLAGRSVRLSGLFPDAPDDPDATAFGDARRRLTAIHKVALTNLEEKGIETLFAAIGLATWRVESGAPPNAPVVLLPLEVEATGAAARDFEIKVSGDAHLNPVLAHLLRTEHDIETDEEEADVAEDPPTTLDGFRALFNRLEETWNALPDLTIELRAVSAVFSYATMPLVTDLDQNGGVLAASDIVAAIAGDGEAREVLGSRICDPKPNQPDVDPPGDEFLVLDADSSQHMAINRVLGGESLVIQGPPGTGKSQTIANLITSLIARDQRILFVAEKRAAIEAVTKRLDQVGLGDLVMDMHGGVTSRRDFARTLNDSLERVAAIPELDYSALHGRLQERREVLTTNSTALHEPRDPWKLSVFDMRNRLLALPKAAHTRQRLSAETARAIDSDGFRGLAGEIEEWVSLGGHALAESHPEWSRSSITAVDAARRAFDLATELERRLLPAACDALFAVLDERALPRPDKVAEWDRTARFLVVASGPWWRRLLARVFSKDYRVVKRSLGHPGTLSLTPGELGVLKESVGALASGFAALGEVAGLDDLVRLPHTDLSLALNRMVSNRTTVANLPRLRGLEARFDEAGAGEIIQLVGGEIPPEHAAGAVEHAWLGRVLEDLEFEDPRIAAFDSSTHSRHRDEFTETDCRHRDSTPQRVHRLTAEAIIETMNGHPEETMLVRREAAKKRRHLSVRQLLTRAPQTVIAGDSRQLPPTSFFGHAADDETEVDEDDLSLTQDIESLLDAAGALLRDKMLQWHYRSRDDRLIAFSNVHIYGGSLTAFPGATVSTPITHCLIPFRSIKGVVGTRSNPDEVEKVVELVLEHARETPDETLGVIAFGQRHADNIENVLLRRLSEANDPSFDEFFSETKEERFFVKNIERVQGDERDVIILSVGYHKDANGNLPYRFGPILQEGGERRLNVAVTRARSRITLVSSFSHRDMDPGRSSAKGVDLLRQYLEYAASGGENLGAQVDEVPLNPFELAIRDGLEGRGISVTPQYGVSGFRIDFACAHPDEPGRMVLAIEADGAAYHSAATARDRDRLRQQVLEGKGWRFHRIWSTSWFREREAELDKAEEAWKRAVEASDSDKPSEPEASPDDPPGPQSPERGPRPDVPPKGTPGYDSITDYSLTQLVALARWIKSDTLLRTDDDLIREMMDELGFKRAGKRIMDALTMAIAEARL